jgi:hypothetical protein
MAQFQGLRTDGVRYNLELTWWPGDATVKLSRRVLTRSPYEDRWQLEDLAVSEPMDWDEAQEEAEKWVRHALVLLKDESYGPPPFP